MELYAELIEKTFFDLLEDTAFTSQWRSVGLFSNVSDHGEVEIERKLIKKLNGTMANIIAEQTIHGGTMCINDIKGNGDDFSSVIALAKGYPPEFQSLGKILYRIVDHGEGLDLIFTIQMKTSPSKRFTVNISDYLPFLSVEANPELLEDIFDPEPKLVLIDFEWINYFKPASVDKSTTPDQVSEYAIMAEGAIYNSDYLRVDSNIVKKIHKKLLDKQGVTKEILLERHKNGEIGRAHV